jgi:hypothetical protein
MTDLPLEQLRKYRYRNTNIVRRNIPTISLSNSILIQKIIISVLIFAFSVVIFEAILGNLLGVIAGAFCVSLFIFWPIYYVKYIEHNTKKQPSEEILNRFSDHYYGSLKQHMIKNGFVTLIPKPAVEESLPDPTPIKTDSFRLWLGTTTEALVNLWHKSGMAKGQQVSLNLEEACQNPFLKIVLSLS